MKTLKLCAVAAGLMIAGPAMTMAQTTAPSGAGAAPAAGETSDRTPGTRTETPLSQRDTTTAVPAGSSAVPPKPGTTSDRTPEGPDQGASGAVGSTTDTSGTKGKTTTGDDVKTPHKY